MSEEISIKIKILDREYPMQIHAAEEELYRAAGKELNERCRALQQEFRQRGTVSQQDILSLAGFVTIVEKFKLEAENNALQDAVNNKITSLNALLNPSS